MLGKLEKKVKPDQSVTYGYKVPEMKLSDMAGKIVKWVAATDEKLIVRHLARFSRSTLEKLQENISEAIKSHYCDGCKFLSLTEKEQDLLQRKAPHVCIKYGVVLKHNGQHPYMSRLNECKGDRECM